MADPARRSAIVLVVEDEPLQRMAMLDLVEEGGFTAIEAANAAAAVELLEARNDVRLVLSDIDMPGISGLELAALVRDRWPPLEIVIVSAGSPPGASDLPERVVFLPKPLDHDRLLAILRRMAGDAEA